MRGPTSDRQSRDRAMLVMGRCPGYFADPVAKNRMCEDLRMCMSCSFLPGRWSAPRQQDEHARAQRLSLAGRAFSAMSSVLVRVRSFKVPMKRERLVGLVHCNTRCWTRLNGGWNRCSSEISRATTAL
jgi:hypothetical protein